MPIRSGNSPDCFDCLQFVEDRLDGIPQSPERRHHPRVSVGPLFFVRPGRARTCPPC